MPRMYGPLGCSDGRWHGILAAVQTAATEELSVDYWWEAAGKDLLIVQPEFDAIATIENARQIVEELSNKSKLVADLIPDTRFYQNNQKLFRRLFWSG